MSREPWPAPPGGPETGSISREQAAQLLRLARSGQGEVVSEAADWAYAAMPDGRSFDFAGQPMYAPIVDSVGAGDAFSAVAIAGLLSDWPMDILLRRADAFARQILGIRGAVPQDDRLYEQARGSWKKAQ